MVAQHMPEWQVNALLDLQAYYTGGQGGEVDTVLAGLLGRAPRAAHRGSVPGGVRGSFRGELTSFAGTCARALPGTRRMSSPPEVLERL